MSKKKFSEGLDDLFKDLPVEVEAWSHAGEGSARERKVAHKNFMHDLDVLFQEAMDDSFNQESELPAAAQPGIKSKSESAYRAPVSGLDALIRQTIDVRELNTDEETGKKRLTVAVEKVKLEKLKTIARLENSYLKDILIHLIDEYIQEYTQQKGVEV